MQGEPFGLFRRAPFGWGSSALLRYLAKWNTILGNILVNSECIYVIYINRCHIPLPTFHINSYIGINREQREDSPWATLLPHR